MRYFYDTEFIDNGRTIELISIGVVAEDRPRILCDINGIRSRACWPVGAQERAAETAVPIVEAVAFAAPDPRRPTRRSSTSTATEPIELWGVGKRLRPRGDVPAVGPDDRSAAADPAVHPRIAAVLGGTRVPTDATAAREAHDALVDAKHNLRRFQLMTDLMTDEGNWAQRA